MIWACMVTSRPNELVFISVTQKSSNQINYSMRCLETYMYCLLKPFEKQ